MSRALSARLERPRGTPTGGADETGEGILMRMRPMHRGGMRVLRVGGPLGLVVGVVSIVFFAVIAMISLAAAMVFLRGRGGSRRVTGNEQTPPRVRERSTAE